MREIFLNNDKLKEGLKEYSRIKELKDGWLMANADLLGIVDLTSFGSWRDMYDVKNLSINTDISDFSQDITSMYTTLDEADTQCCRLLNRVYDFYDILDGSATVILYPPTLSPGVIKNLFYDSAYYNEIKYKCADIVDRDETENIQLDLIDEYATGFEYLSPDVLSAEVETVRKDIEKQKNIADFSDSFTAFAEGVATFNETIGTALYGLAEDIESIPEATRDYTFPGLNLSTEQKSKIWFAEYVDDYEKDHYVDVPDSDKYIKQVYELYSKSQGPAKELFDQYKGKIKIASMEVPSDKASYHRGGYLYINLDSDVDDPRGNGVTFYHETGHFIVYSTGALNSQEMKDFDKALKDGVTDYIERKEQQAATNLANANYNPSMAGYQEELEKETKKCIQADIDAVFGTGADTALYDGITDMIDAASNHKYAIGYTHINSDPDYWWRINDPTYWEDDPTRQSNEAFAEMFAADMQGDNKELEFIDKNFGNVYDEYEDLRDYMIAQGAQ